MQGSQPAAVFGITSDSSGFFFIFDSLLNRAVSFYLAGGSTTIDY
jgi:hypothetical protein